VTPALPLAAAIDAPRDAPGVPEGHALRLEGALALLRQSGVELPPGFDPQSPAGVQALVDALCTLSSRDALTGLANRRHFEAALAAEIDRVARAGEAALLLLLDIDHFKKVNDTYGHPAGDAVLRAVAGSLADCVRPMDTVARFGGEEFAVILPNCEPAFGHTVAERIRAGIHARSVPVAPGVALQVTVSIGGAFAPKWVRTSGALWIERADQQLYRAKAAGRNRTHLEMPPVTSVSAEEKGLLFAASSFQDLDP
jgi:diguanylate cyclase (GGDEF)-like protein